MDRQDGDSDNESEAYLGDDDGNVGPEVQEVADLDGAEAGVWSGSCRERVHVCMLPAVLVSIIVPLVSDAGYESDSEEGQDEGTGPAEIADDAAHCFKEHTGLTSWGRGGFLLTSMNAIS